MRSKYKYVCRKQEFSRIYNTSTQNLIDLLALLWWEEILNIDDVEAQYERTYDILGTSHDQAFPLIKTLGQEIKKIYGSQQAYGRAYAQILYCILKSSRYQVIDILSGTKSINLF